MSSRKVRSNSKRLIKSKRMVYLCPFNTRFLSTRWGCNLCSNLGCPVHGLPSRHNEYPWPRHINPTSADAHTVIIQVSIAPQSGSSTTSSTTQSAASPYMSSASQTLQAAEDSLQISQGTEAVWWHLSRREVQSKVPWFLPQGYHLIWERLLLRAAVTLSHPTFQRIIRKTLSRFTSAWATWRGVDLVGHSQRTRSRLGCPFDFWFACLPTCFFTLYGRAMIHWGWLFQLSWCCGGRFREVSNANFPWNSMCCGFCFPWLVSFQWAR